MQTERYALIRSSETLRKDRVIGWYTEVVANQIQKEREAVDCISTYYVLPECKVPENMKN